MARSSRPSSVGLTRSARYSWPFTTLLFGPVVHLAPRGPTAATAAPVSARRCGSARFQLLCEQRSTRCCRRCRPATRSASAQQPGPGRSQPAAGFATLVAGRRCLAAILPGISLLAAHSLAAICRRDDAQQVHFAGKRQPTRACHSNSNHFSVCSFWDAPHGLGRGSVYTRTFCPPSPSASAPAQRHRSLRLPARSSTLALMPAALMSQQRAHPPTICCRALPWSAMLGVLISSLYLKVQYRQQPIPASDHRICWPIAPSGGYLQGIFVGALSVTSIRRDLSVF